MGVACGRRHTRHTEHDSRGECTWTRRDPWRVCPGPRRVVMCPPLSSIPLNMHTVGQNVSLHLSHTSQHTHVHLHAHATTGRRLHMTNAQAPLTQSAKRVPAKEFHPPRCSSLPMPFTGHATTPGVTGSQAARSARPAREAIALRSQMVWKARNDPTCPCVMTTTPTPGWRVRVRVRVRVRMTCG